MMDPCAENEDISPNSSLRWFPLLQLARKFPDIGRVKVDKFGNIVGGVNPFEGTDVKLEDQPTPDDDEKVWAVFCFSRGQFKFPIHDAFG